MKGIDVNTLFAIFKVVVWGISEHAIKVEHDPYVMCYMKDNESTKKRYIQPVVKLLFFLEIFGKTSE